VQLIYKYDNGEFLDVLRSDSAEHSLSDFHIHDYYEIFYHIKGALDFFINTHIYNLRPGDLVILRNSEIHNTITRCRSGCAFAKIHFKPEIIRHVSFEGSTLNRIFTDRTEGSSNLLRPSLRESAILDTFFGDIADLGMQQRKNPESHVLSYFIRILCMLDGIFRSGSGQMDHSHYNPILRGVLTYINNNLQHDLRLDSLCKIFYISPQHLIRLFRNMAGGSIHNYIINKRLILAKHLLKESCSVEESCIRSGFNDYSNFIRIFKSRIGVSPGKYLENNIN
jgi:AraC-like DNA-binding protein